MLRTRESAETSPYLPPAVAAWAKPRAAVSSDTDAAFMAGAASNTLDNLVRAQPVWAGVWRQRLALKCAVSAVRLTGRNEDEAALRDVWAMRNSGGDLGPAGNILSACKRLTARSVTVDTKTLHELADLFGLRWSEELAAIPALVDNIAQAGKAPPFAAAAIVAGVHALRPDAEPLGWWLADWLLAQQMRWHRPVPLLMAQRYSSAFRTAGAKGRIRPGEPGFERAICLALVHGAADALRLAADIARRADRLASVAPKLRTKGAGEVIRLLLDDDALSGSAPGVKMSRWASSRLFERLIAFDAVRELSGRSTFRIYGL